MSVCEYNKFITLILYHTKIIREGKYTTLTVVYLICDKYRSNTQIKDDSLYNLYTKHIAN